MPYLAPTAADEALDFLHSGPARIVAGCTDYFPGLLPGEQPENILDVTRIKSFQGITRGSAGWRIGASVTWSEIAKASLPPGFDGLKLAAREVGAVQIQNRATVAGNICNASPAADGVPPLLTLGAEVEIISKGGRRLVPLADFITGVRATDLQPQELVAAIHIPDEAAGWSSHFAKLGSREHLVISIVMAAAAVRVEDGVIRDARVAAGSCSPVAQRLPSLEQALTGRAVTGLSPALFSEEALYAPLSPISDVRATAEYRRDAAAELCCRAVRLAAAKG